MFTFEKTARTVRDMPNEFYTQVTQIVWLVVVALLLFGVMTYLTFL